MKDNFGLYILAFAAILGVAGKINEYFETKDNCFLKIFSRWIYRALLLFAGLSMFGIPVFFIELYKNPKEGLAGIGYLVLLFGFIMFVYLGTEKINNYEMPPIEKKALEFIFYGLCIMFYYCLYWLQHSAV